MSKTKISVLTKIAIILTVLGSITTMPVAYMNVIPIGFMGMGGLFCAFAFLFGICGIITAIKDRNRVGIIICIVCVLSNVFLLFHLPSIGVAREPAKRISCRSNIKQIQLALKQYSADYSGNFPPANGAAGLEYLRKCDYLADYAVYTCPSTRTAKGKGKQPLTEDIVDYVYVGGLNEKSVQNTPILYDKSGNHQDFGNVGTVDGAAKGIAGKDWMKEIRK